MKVRSLYAKLPVSVLITALVAAGGISISSRAVSASVRPHDEPHGVNFTVKSGLDPNFCMEVDRVLSGSTTTAKVTMQVCNGAKDGQHWVMVWDADKSVVIVAPYGQCLDAHGFVAGKAMTTNPCTFSKTSQRFVYSSAQRFQNESGTRCLGIPSGMLVGGRAVSVQMCNRTKYQIWTLGH